jgi:hypothetical protein
MWRVFRYLGPELGFYAGRTQAALCQLLLVSFRGTAAIRSLHMSSVTYSFAVGTHSVNRDALSCHMLQWQLLAACHGMPSNVVH